MTAATATRWGAQGTERAVGQGVATLATEVQAPVGQPACATAELAGRDAAVDTTIAAGTEAVDVALDSQEAASAPGASDLLLRQVDAMDERLRVWRRVDQV